MKIIQTNEFAKAVKKLPVQHKVELDTAVKAIVANPAIGELKLGDLAGVRVYKFKMNKQLTLLGYESLGDEHTGTLTLYLLKLGSHENFYRDLKGR